MKKETSGKNYFKFLGTAGARFVVAKQLRYSAGVYLHFAGKSIILDPGPGALVRCARSRPPIDATALDALILTHSHIDHTSDANVLIDAMTLGGLRRRGTLFAPGECVNGEHRVILKYLRDFLDELVVLTPLQNYFLGSLRFSTSVRHHHGVETYGIIFTVGGTRVSFMADTRFFPELLESYRHSDILVMNVVRYAPHDHGDILHLSVDDVKSLVKEIRPKKAILTHLGMTMLRKRPPDLSKQLSDELGIETIVATDGMTVTVDGD
ncbi:MAG: MBL fold metallo-hydrolase [Endomicrobiales bacterium]